MGKEKERKEKSVRLITPSKVLSTTDLIARRAIALQKRHAHISEVHSAVFATRREAAIKFERKHGATICNYEFLTGTLVLVRNTAIEKALNCKMRLW